MEKKLTPKSTKNEIMAAYDDLLKKVQEQKIEDPKKMQEEQKNTKVIKEASGNTLENIIKSMSAIKLNVAREVDKLSDELTAEFKKLENVQSAIKLEKGNLEELYQISANTDSLAALILAQKEKQEQFENEMALRKNTFDEDIKAEQVKFDVEKESWKQEQQKWEKLQKEISEKTEIERSRGEEEYNYSLTIKRKKETDQYEEKKSAQEKELKEKRMIFEKEIAEREAKVVEVESELKELRKKSVEFPSELEKAILETEKSVKEKLEMQFNFEKELSNKQTEGELKLRDQEITSLQAKIKEQDAFVKELSAKANSANANSKDIAIKAIESSSKIQIIEKSKEVSGKE